MTTKVYSGGIWKDITNFYVRNSGSWQEADTVYKKISSNWKIIYDRGPYNWSGAGVSAFGFGFFDQGADVSVLFDNIGNFSYSGGPNIFSSVEPGSYAPSSKVSSLEIRYNVTTPPATFSGSSINVWLPLTTSQGWSLSLPSGIVNDTIVTGTVLIKRGDLLVASGTLGLSASVYSIG